MADSLNLKPPAQRFICAARRVGFGFAAQINGKPPVPRGFFQDVPGGASDAAARG